MTPQSIGPDPMILLIAAFFSLALLFWGFRSFHRKRIIDDTPTLKTIGVFIGLAELKGTAETEKPLKSYLTETQCVQYSWRIEEQWRRQVTETYHDSEGRTKTRTRTETGWRTVDQGGESPKFYLRDETGVIRIDPRNADINGELVLNEVFTRRHPMYYGKGPRRSVSNSRHRRRFTETLIPLHSQIYVIGQARERDDIIAAEIAYDEEEPLYVISTDGEKTVSSSYGNYFILLSIIGLIITGLPIVFSENLISPLVFAPAGVYLLAFCLGWLFVVYNSIVSLENSVDQARSLIDIQLKRRSDLIPRLVEIVEGYQKHEQNIHTYIAELRAQANVSGEAEAVAPILVAIDENYPELKAGEQYLDLQKSLEETEQRIALARDYYNQIANFYNTRLDTIPDRYIAKLAALKPQPLWSGKDFRRATIDTDISMQSTTS